MYGRNRIFYIWHDYIAGRKWNYSNCSIHDNHSDFNRKKTQRKNRTADERKILVWGNYDEKNNFNSYQFNVADNFLWQRKYSKLARTIRFGHEIPVRGKL